MNSSLETEEKPAGEGRRRPMAEDVSGTILAVVATALIVSGIRDMRVYAGDLMLLRGVAGMVIALPVAGVAIVRVIAGTARLDPAERGRRLARAVSAIVAAGAVLWLGFHNYDFVRFGEVGGWLSQLSPESGVEARIAGNVVVALVGVVAAVVFAETVASSFKAKAGLVAAAVVVLGTTGIVAPVASLGAHRRHVQPLINYVSKNWIRVPLNAEISVERTGYIGIYRGHMDHVRIWTPEEVWFVEGIHQEKGWAGCSVFGYSNLPASLKSAEDVKEHVRMVTVDTSLGKVRLVGGIEGKWYEVQRRAGGRYKVKYRGDVEIEPPYGLVVPDR